MTTAMTTVMTTAIHLEPEYERRNINMVLMEGERKRCMKNTVPNTTIRVTMNGIEINKNIIQLMNEVCQYNQLRMVFTDSYNVMNCMYQYMLEIYKDDNKIVSVEGEKYDTLKMAKYSACEKCMKNEEMNKMLYNKLNNSSMRQPQFRSFDYIKWGSTWLKDMGYRFPVPVNDIGVLDRFDTLISLDSEGFDDRKMGRYPQLVQIADGKSIAFFDYEKYHHIIRPFLESKYLIMCSAKDDLRELNIQPKKYIDIQDMYKEKMNVSKRVSLKKMAELISNKQFSRPPGYFYAYSKWNVNTLDYYHKVYSATDVVLTYHLYKHLQKM